MTAQELIAKWIADNPRHDGEDDREWQVRCRTDFSDMPRSTFSAGWYAASGLQKPQNPAKAKRTATDHTQERRTDKLTIVLAPSAARKLRIMCAIENTKPSAWIENAILNAPDPKI